MHHITSSHHSLAHLCNPTKRKVDGTTVALSFFLVVFHAVFILSIFDSYFTSPIVHGMKHYENPSGPQAKRMLFVVSDGLRAHQFYQNTPKFLRSHIESDASWGISHTRVPTESRPGHVAMFAGIYEDPSAVLKAWKENPVDFETIFHNAKYTWNYGDHDVMSLFLDLPHVHTTSYPSSFVKFSEDPRKYDNWVFDRVDKLFSEPDEETRRKLREPNIILFLHLMGGDAVGHGDGAFSETYTETMRNFDARLEKLYKSMQEFYQDDSTLVVFTSDHGMTDTGSHGSGEVECTRTPFVMFGPGIQKSPLEKDHQYNKIILMDPNDESELKEEVDVTERVWKLNSKLRKDIRQADMAPLLANLLGQQVPVNSVGRIPVEYLDENEQEYRAQSVLTTAKVIVEHARRKEEVTRERRMFFLSNSGVEALQNRVSSVENLLAKAHGSGDHAHDNPDRYYESIETSYEIIDDALRALRRLHTYDWGWLMFLVVVGYLGCCLFCISCAIESFSVSTVMRVWKSKQILLGGSLAMGTCFMYSLSQGFSFSFYMYATLAMTVLTAVVLRWSMLSFDILLPFAKSLPFLGAIIYAYYEREVLSYASWFIGATFLGMHSSLTWKDTFLWCSANVCVGYFTSLPFKMPLRVDLIEYGGFTIAAMGVIGVIRIRKMEGLPLRFSLDMIKEHKHFGMQILFVLIATIVAVSIENDLALGLGLSFAKQFVVWIVFLQSFVTWWWSERKPFERVLSIFLSFGSAFVLFSVNFESLFYATLGVTLFVWIELENKIRQSNGDRQSDVHKLNVTTACLLLILTEISFFGTGNMASVSSFKIKSVTRFFVEYHPFVMMALLLIKLVIPFFLVTGAFALICVRNKIQQFNVFLMTVGLCDIMALALYFLVRDEGSWKDIGDSLSRFVIINCMVVFFLLVLLFAQVFMAGISQKKREEKDDDHLP